MFTDRKLRALKPRATAYRVYEGSSDPGFGVQVTPKGVVSFFQQYSWHGKRRFLTLGAYPLLSLADARNKAREVRRDVAAGRDPRHKATEATVRDVFTGYVAHMRRQGKASADEVERALLRGKEDFAEYLDWPADALTSAHLRDALRAMLRRGAGVMANRARSYVHSAYRWAIRHDNDPNRSGPAFGVRHNPATDVPVPTREAPGERVLSWEELAAAWHADIPLLHRAAIRLLIVTGGQRVREVVEAQWAEFEPGLWSMPRTKNGRPHLVPLTTLAEEVVAEIRTLVPSGRYLFPLSGDPRLKRPFRDDTLYKAVSGWTPRDLRRTCKTLMGEAGVDKFTRDRIQNHAINDVSGKHYDRYSYLTEKRAGLETWERELRARLGITTRRRP